MRILPTYSQDGMGQKLVKLDADFAYGESGAAVSKKSKIDADFAYGKAEENRGRVEKIASILPMVSQDGYEMKK